MKKIVSLLALIGFVSPLVALAEDNGALLNYNFFDAEYRHTYNQGTGVGQTDALGLTGSYSFNKTLFGFIDYDYGKTDFRYRSSVTDGDLGIFGNSFKITDSTNTLTYGVGARKEIAKNVDAVATVAGVYRNVNISDFGDIDDRGIDLAFGVRTLPSELLEVDLFATFENNDVFSDGWSYNANFLVPLGCSTALKTTVAIDDQSDVGIASGLRFAY